MKQPQHQWKFSLKYQVLMGLGLFALGLIGSFIWTINTKGKKLVFEESSRLIQQTGDNAVSSLIARSMEIEALTRTLGLMAQQLPKSETTFKNFLPNIINFHGDLEIAGGGVWPEPYLFDATREKRSFFWARKTDGELAYYDDYNRLGYHHQDWYVVGRYLKPGQCFWSRSYVDPLSLQPMVTCTIAMQKNNQFLGSVTIDIKLEELQSFTESWQKKTGGYIFIVDRDNGFISFPDPDLVKRVGKDSQGKQTIDFIKASDLAKIKPLFAAIAIELDNLNHYIVEQLKTDKNFNIASRLTQESEQIDQHEGELINVILQDPLGEQTKSTRLLKQFTINNDWLLKEESTVYIFHVPKTYWKLVVVKPKSESIAVASSISQFLTNRVILIVLLSVILALIVVRFRLLKPIKNLSYTAQKIEVDPSQLSQNEWQQGLPTKRNDEIGELAQAFKNMGIQLNELLEKLEEKVKARTTELANANQKITALNEKLQEENLRMAVELNVAKTLQKLVLPNPEELDSIEGLEISGFMEPADEVGGDYYDVLYSNGVVTIGIGDVTGHGLESGILMLMTQTAVRTLKEKQEQDPIRFLDTLNRTIYGNVIRMKSEKNLSLAILNYSDHRVSISGQHEETLVVRAGGKIERIDTIDLGLPIGLDGEIADFIDHKTLELRSGDGIVLYTDGITEAFNLDKQQYGIDRLCKVISENWQYNAETVKQAIIKDVQGFIGEQKVFDDITVVVLKQK